MRVITIILLTISHIRNLNLFSKDKITVLSFLSFLFRGTVFLALSENEVLQAYQGQRVYLDHLEPKDQVLLELWDGVETLEIQDLQDPLVLLDQRD